MKCDNEITNEIFPLANNDGKRICRFDICFGEKKLKIYANPRNIRNENTLKHLHIFHVSLLTTANHPSHCLFINLNSWASYLWHQMICIKNFHIRMQTSQGGTLKEKPCGIFHSTSRRKFKFYGQVVDERNALHTIELKCGRVERMFPKIFTLEYAARNLRSGISIHSTHPYLNFHLTAEIRKN